MIPNIWMNTRVSKFSRNIPQTQLERHRCGHVPLRIYLWYGHELALSYRILLEAASGYEIPALSWILFNVNILVFFLTKKKKSTTQPKRVLYSTTLIPPPFFWCTHKYYYYAHKRKCAYFFKLKIQIFDTANSSIVKQENLYLLCSVNCQINTDFIVFQFFIKNLDEKFRKGG